MPITPNEAKSLAYEVALEAFYKYFSTRTDVTTSHILLSVLFPDESAIRSIMGGLETSLGTRLWENLARFIAEKNDFVVKNPKTELMRPVNLPAEVTNLIGQWRELRETSHPTPSMAEYKVALSKLLPNLTFEREFQHLNKGSGADLFLVKGDQEWAFDIKTVQINAGSGPKFNGTLMEWVAYRAIMQSQTNNFLNVSIVIPYDPTVNEWWHHFSGRISPLTQEDVVVADNFWDFLGGVPGVLDFIKAGFSELNRDHGELLRLALLGMSNEVHLRLVNISRKVQPTKSSNGWTKGRISWTCQLCGSNFEATYNNINKAEKTCPNHCKKPISLVMD